MRDARVLRFDVSDTEAPAAVVAEDAEPICVREVKDTEANPPLDTTATIRMPALEAWMERVAASADTGAKRMDGAANKDSVAVVRGIEAITRPSLPLLLPPAPRRQRAMIAAISVAGVCLAVTIGTIVWAQDAVANAKTTPATNIVEEPAANVVEEPAPRLPPAAPVEEASNAAAPVSTDEIEIHEPQAAPAPGRCSVEITSSIERANVLVNNRRGGIAPATAVVPCGQPVTIEVRRARYASFKQTVTPTMEHQVVAATLERERTTVKLVSDPPAVVTVDGVTIGKTPMTTTVSRFEQTTFHFRAAGFRPDWRRIAPKQRQSTVTLKLEPR